MTYTKDNIVDVVYSDEGKLWTKIVATYEDCAIINYRTCRGWELAFIELEHLLSALNCGRYKVLSNLYFNPINDTA